MSERPDAAGGSPGLAPEDCSVEAYETGRGTVLYDARNPLAWIESSRAVPIDDLA